MENNEENNNTVIVTQKKGKSTGVIIAILIIVVIGLIGYICYDKELIIKKKDASVKTEEKIDNNSKTEEEAITFTEEQLRKYVNYISPSSNGVPKLLFDTSKVVAKDLSPKEKIDYIANYLFEKDVDSSITESDVKSTVEEVYGPNTYQRTTFNLGCGDYIFNEKDSKYYTVPGCGGTSAEFVSNQIVDYKATKSKLEITTAYAFYSGETQKIYKDFNKAVVLDSYKGEETESIDKYLDNYVKANKDKLNTIVYTFESNDGNNYYFTGFVNNK